MKLSYERCQNCGGDTVEIADAQAYVRDLKSGVVYCQDCYENFSAVFRGKTLHAVGLLYMEDRIALLEKELVSSMNCDQVSRFLQRIQDE